MLIVGEKINGTRKLVAKAIAERDAAYIKDLALKQVEGGVTWLDVNAGVSPALENEALIWLIDTVQSVTDTTLCLDSANPAALVAATSHVKKTPMINSISGEAKKLAEILPLVSQNKCPVIAQALDDAGIPKDVASRMTIIRRIMEETRKAGIADNNVYIDPLVMSLATNTEAGLIALDTIKTIRVEFPEVHIMPALSNVSFGLPARTVVNQAFLTLAITSGMDCAILDPNDKGLRSAIMATEVIMGRDRYCMNFNRAFRAGRLSVAPKV
ncbi:MAG: dihydropteroate synthase [Dehalococcoidales bacterium]|nr:dihydropteroate synthase [Dehalococcoidales bacterium]